MVAFVIRYPGVVNIDGNPLRSQIILAAGLTDTKNSIRLFFVDRGIDHINGFAEYRGHRESDNFDIIKLFRKQFHCLQGRIDGFLVKRVERGEKDFHEMVILSVLQKSVYSLSWISLCSNCSDRTSPFPCVFT